MYVYAEKIEINWMTMQIILIKLYQILKIL